MHACEMLVRSTRHASLVAPPPQEERRIEHARKHEEAQREAQRLASEKQARVRARVCACCGACHLEELRQHRSEEDGLHSRTPVAPFHHRLQHRNAYSEVGRHSFIIIMPIWRFKAYFYHHNAYF